MTFFIKLLHPQYIIQRFKHDATINLPVPMVNHLSKGFDARGCSVKTIL
jgi:hypothetical protein